MDNSAIKLIQETAIDAQKIRLPSQLDGVAMVIPDNYELRGIEGFLPNRLRFRGKFQTNSINDFIEYVKSHPSDSGFIDPDDLSANIFFNLGSEDKPGHADWTARLEAKKTSEFQAVLCTNGCEMSQSETVDFIEDWAHLLGAFKLTSNGEHIDISIPTVISSIRKIKIDAKSTTEVTQENFRAQTSRLDSVEASSEEGLPDFMTFTAIPYLGLSPRTFSVRLSILSGGSSPKIKFRIVGLEKQKEEIGQEFKAILTKEIGDKARMTIGTFVA